MMGDGDGDGYKEEMWEGFKVVDVCKECQSWIDVVELQLELVAILGVGVQQLGCGVVSYPRNLGTTSI